MTGHKHNSSAGTQNQGNSLGDRSCVRQSKLYRKYESGNDVKSLLGTSNLCWDPTQKEGAYQGQKVYDFDEHQNILQGTSGYRQPERIPARQDYGDDQGYGSKNYGNGGNNADYGYAPKNYGGGNDYSSNNYSKPPVNNASKNSRPYAGDDANTYSTSNNSYGMQNSTKNYGNDYGSEGYGYNQQRRRDSFNDENQPRNQPRRNGGGGGGSVGGGGGYDDNAYRNMKEQSNYGSSSFQSMRGKDNNEDAGRSSIRTYHGGSDANRSTRPW